MDQTTDQITRDIRNKREDLSSNFKELESKVKSTWDWRYQFQNHTGAMIAAAFATGALVSVFGAGRRVGASAGPTAAPIPGTRAGSNSSNEVLARWNSMKSALVGVAAGRITGYLNQIVPGFHEELKKAETSNTRGSG